MKNREKLPKSLAEKQEFQRQQTINKVLRAIADMEGEGRKVTISALVEFTGLSRSTFAKPHIRVLLTEYGYSAEKAVQGKQQSGTNKQSEIVAEKDRLIAELRVKNAELERECELLRGRLFLVMQNRE